MVSPFRLPQYDIWLRDQNYNVLERLDLWSSLTIIQRFNRAGTWNLELPANSKIARHVTPSTGIIVQRDGQTIFSGSAGTDYEENLQTIKISGEDDNALLYTPARPTPSLAVEPYNHEYDVRTGVASTIMRQLVDVNIGPSAPVEWRITGLTLAADPVIGSTITSRARFDPLIILLAELASTPIATGLGFRILQSDLLANTLEFQIYVPEDKHLTTKFSVDLHTAQDYEYKQQFPSANHFIVAGGDDFGQNRTIVSGGDATSIAEVGRRISQFVDKRGVIDPGELNQELAELIAGAVTTRVINIIPTDIPVFRHGDDYDLGDYVTAVIKGVEYARLIREVEINFDPKRGPIIIPTVADPAGTNDELGARHLFTLQDRISNIERNFNVPNNSIIADMLHETMRWYVGDYKETARSAAQPGWLLCNGAAVSRSTYSSLFAAIGTQHGNGDGSTTFNIPNFIDRQMLGTGSGAALALGQYGGAASFTHNHGPNTLQLPHQHSHEHGVDNHSHVLYPHDHDSGSYTTDNGVTGIPSDTDTPQSGSGDIVAGPNHTHVIPQVDVTGISGAGERQGTGDPFEATDTKTGLGTDTDTSNVSSWQAPTGVTTDAVISVLYKSVGVNIAIYTGVVV